MRNTRAQLPSSFLIMLALAVACGEDSNAPGTATLEITTTTAGVEPDPDGYLVQVDAGEPQAIGTGATVQIPDVAAGDHSILLAGVAPNCTVEEENPHTL